MVSDVRVGEFRGLAMKYSDLSDDDQYEIVKLNRLIRDAGFRKNRQRVEELQARKSEIINR